MKKSINIVNNIVEPLNEKETEEKIRVNEEIEDKVNEQIEARVNEEYRS